MTSQEIIQAAKAEQGGDAFPGIDQYRAKTLPAGTKLVKLEPSSSGFFIPWEEYLRCNRDANQLSKQYQIAPRNTKNRNDIPFDYDYRNKASLFVTTRDIKVAEGSTLMNPQYGPGGPKQIHLADYKVGNDLQNAKIGIQQTHTLKLTNPGLNANTGDAFTIQARIHKQIRNYHAALSQKMDLLKLQDQLTSPGHKKICADKLETLEKICSDIQKRIERNTNQFQSLYPTMPPPTAPTYEKVIGYQEKLAASADQTKVFSPKLDKESRDLREHLTAKVDMTAGKIIRGEWKPGQCDQEVKIDEVRKIYETDQFVKRALCQKQLVNNSNRVEQLERAMAQFGTPEQRLYHQGKLGHTLQEPPPGLMGEITALKQEGQLLRGELKSLEHRQDDYQQFLSLCGKAPELKGPGLRF